MDDGFLMVLAEGACYVAGNASISKSFPHRYTAMKAKLYEMLDFLSCIVCVVYHKIHKYLIIFIYIYMTYSL